YRHLSKYRQKLLNRNKEETGKRYEWYALQRYASDYYPEFEKEKIVWQRVSKEQRFSIVDKGFYCEATTHLITGNNLRFLLGVLNSKMFGFAFYRFYMGGGIEGEIKGEFIGRFPIPPLTPQNKHIADRIEELVDQIIQKKKQNGCGADTSDLEEQIDQLVYELYGLTKEEIKIVEEG
ncbi:MAG: TaqI-like C-terminal specificity domain-containing protein, partial [Aquificaceae bacterium]